MQNNLATTAPSPTVSTSETRFGPLRSLVVGTKVWFIAADVCKALGLSNTGKALANITGSDVSEIRLQKTGRPHKLVSESGLYDLVLQSRKPSARNFRNFLTSEVIPSIFKHGIYVAGQGQMTDSQLQEAISERGDSLVNRTRAERSLAYNREIARIEANGGKATAWEKFIAGKP